MFKSLLTKIPQASSKQGLFAGNAKKAFSIAQVGANGRKLPLADDKSLMEHDPEMAELLLKEQKRQFRGIELIASENFAGKYTL